MRSRSFAMVFVVGIVCSAVQAAARAGDTHVTSEEQRAARIQELQRQRALVERELRQLHKETEGTAQTRVPRSELESQPTRTLQEPLESVPGVVVRPGGSSRNQQLSIRGISP